MKSRNGQGSGKNISLTFDPNIPVERKALEMSQRLAGIGHGVRKSVIVAALAALSDLSDLIGRDVTTEELSAMYLKLLMNGGVQQSAPRLELERQEGEVLVETDSRGTSYEDIAANFVGSSMMSGGNDDLWD